MPTILDQIVATNREEIARAKVETPEAALRERLAEAPPVRDFLAALSAGPPISLLKKGTGSEPADVNAAKNSGREVPVPHFQQAATAARRR